MKVLIIGLGSIAKKHIDAIKKISHSAEIFALRSSRESASIDGITNFYSYDDLNISNFDFAIISNPTSEHSSAIKHLLEYKIPMFIEKPIFSKIGNEEQQLLDKINAENIPTYVACNLRFLECIQFIKKEIQDKRINEVNIYCGSYLPDWRPNVDFRKIYSANKEMGGGVHIDLIHELDYTFWLFGEPENTDSLFRNNSSLEISAHDYANYRWYYNDFITIIVLNYYRRDAKRTLEIVCSEGTYFVDLLRNEVSFNNELIFASDNKISETYLQQMKYFLEHVLTKENSNFNTAEEGYKILNLCLKQA